MITNYLPKRSCSDPRSTLSAKEGLTFSLSFPSSCWVVSKQYSAVVKILERNVRSKALSSFNVNNLRYLRADSRDIVFSEFWRSVGCITFLQEALKILNQTSSTS